MAVNTAGVAMGSHRSMRAAKGLERIIPWQSQNAR
jgi:hypothetical protein